jgi:hypothetical protein
MSIDQITQQRLASIRRRLLELAEQLKLLELELAAVASSQSASELICLEAKVKGKP